MGEQEAITGLQELLRVNRELLEAQNTANELKDKELSQKELFLAQEQARIELERQNNELKKLALNRAESRLNEVLQRYVGLGERVEILIGYAQKNLLKDDAFKDILANLSERFETIERSMMFALMEKLAGHQIREEVEDTIDTISDSLIQSSKKRQLLSLVKNLNILKEQKAQGDDSLLVLNKIDKLEEEIARLHGELNA